MEEQPALANQSKRGAICILTRQGKAGPYAAYYKAQILIVSNCTLCLKGWKEEERANNCPISFSFALFISRCYSFSSQVLVIVHFRLGVALHRLVHHTSRGLDNYRQRCKASVRPFLWSFKCHKLTEVSSSVSSETPQALRFTSDWLLVNWWCIKKISQHPHWQ